MDAANDVDDMIGMIGASPLEDMIVIWSDAALGLVEAEVERTRRCCGRLRARTEGSPIRVRLDAILARHGQERPLVRGLPKAEAELWTSTTDSHVPAENKEPVNGLPRWYTGDD
jgi:hypothetical protein